MPETPPGPKIVTVAGVRYARRRERPAFFARAGDWIYDVRFPDGDSMRIRPSQSRRYHDLTADALPDGFELIAESIRPGSRVFIAGAGTGLAGEMVARIVGDSGGVATTERDGESVRYARKRYPRPNMSVEFATPDPLSGEVDRSFDVAMVLRPIETAMDAPRERAKQELLRVLRPRGRLVALAEDLPEAPTRSRIGALAWLTQPDQRPPAP